MMPVLSKKLRHRPYTVRAHIALLTLCMVAIAVPARAGVVYDDVTVNGSTDVWPHFDFLKAGPALSVSEGPGMPTAVTFGAWLIPGDVPQAVDLSVTSEPFEGTTYLDKAVSLTQSGCMGRQIRFGYNVCTETGNFAGEARLTPPDEGVRNGSRVYWDDYFGEHCTSSSCPSESNCFTNYVWSASGLLQEKIDQGGSTVCVNVSDF